MNTITIQIGNPVQLVQIGIERGWIIQRKQRKTNNPRRDYHREYMRKWRLVRQKRAKSNRRAK